MAARRLRILLSEGSSLSAREIATALGLAGRRVELVSADRFCFARFSRFVDRVHRAPASGADPDGYFAAVIEIVARRAIDALIPSHEQAYLFAAARDRLPSGLGVALAAFSAFEQTQSKTALTQLLARLGIPQPATEIALSRRELLAERPFPYFVKAAFGTASAGVWRVADATGRDRLAEALAARGAFAAGVVVQAAAEGPLERAQAVFDRGRLVAFHAYRQLAEGASGGDVVKMSVRRPAARAYAAEIGAALAWRGALSFDYVLDARAGAPLFIDANPRLVEPVNAWLSGVDLAGALLAVSLGEAPPAQGDGREGVVTKLTLMGLIEAAGRHGRRRDALREWLSSARGAGRYRGAVEELTPARVDPLSAVPFAGALAALMASPHAASGLSRRVVEAYSLTPAAFERARRWAAPAENSA
jgi:predicted ATP-grasp superfamily ATP-dependent carboligase